MGAARGARRSRRGPGLAAVRARAPGVRVARAHGDRPRRARRRPLEELPPALGDVRPPAPRPPRARALRRRAAAGAAARRSDALPGGRGRAGDARARRRGGPRLRRVGHAARADRRSSVPSLERVRAPAGHRVRDARRSLRGRGPRPPRRDAVRSGAALVAAASRGSAAAAASCSRSCARRSRASLGRAATSSRAVCADAPSTTASAPRRRRSGCATGLPLPPLETLRGAADAGRRPSARSTRADAARTPTALEAPPVGERGARRPARAATRCGGCSTSSTPGWRSASRSRADEVVAALERTEVAASARRRAGPRRRARPLARPHAALRGRGRARAGAGRAAAPHAAVPVPRRRRPARARRAALRAPRPPRSGQPRPLSLLHRLHARGAAARARARGGDRRRRSPRAEPVLGGRPRRCSTPDDVAHATRAAPAVAPDVADRGRAHGARAAARARRAARRRLAGRRGARAGERLGAAARARPRRVHAPHASCATRS